MEYITPLMYRKILDVITYIYNRSTYDKTYDLFRFKDVLDSFSEGQIINKVWAAEELNKVIDDSYKECIVIGSWYGLFAHVFIESGFTKRVLNVELDKTEQTSDWSQKKLTKQQIQYAMNDVIYLSDLKKNLEAKLLEAKRLKTFKSIMNFLDTRVELDLMGWENTDIFAHK